MDRSGGQHGVYRRSGPEASQQSAPPQRTPEPHDLIAHGEDASPEVDLDPISVELMSSTPWIVRRERFDALIEFRDDQHAEVGSPQG